MNKNFTSFFTFVLLSTASVAWGENHTYNWQSLSDAQMQQLEQTCKNEMNSSRTDLISAAVSLTLTGGATVVSSNAYMFGISGMKASELSTGYALMVYSAAVSASVLTSFNEPGELYFLTQELNTNAPGLMTEKLAASIQQTRGANEKVVLATINLLAAEGTLCTQKTSGRISPQTVKIIEQLRP